MISGIQVTSCPIACEHQDDHGAVIYRHASRWWVVSAGRITLLDASTCVIKWLAGCHPGIATDLLAAGPVIDLVTEHPDWDPSPYPKIG